MLSKQFLYFLLSGGLAAGFNWGSRFIFSEIFPFEVAVVLAFFIGSLSGFFLMRFFVFDGLGKPALPQVSKYIIVNFIALTQTLLVSLFLAHFLPPILGIKDQAESLAHLIGVLVPVVTSYFGHKFLTFR